MPSGIYQRLGCYIMGLVPMVKPIPKKWLIHEVIHQPLEIDEGWNKEYGKETTIKNVRVEPKKTLQRSSDEYLVVGGFILFIDAVHTTPFKTPSIRDRITFNGEVYTVEDIQPYYGFKSDIHHLEVVLK